MVKRKILLFCNDSIPSLNLLSHSDALNEQICVFLFERFISQHFDLRVADFGEQKQLIDQFELKKLRLNILPVPCRHLLLLYSLLVLMISKNLSLYKFLIALFHQIELLFQFLILQLKQNFLLPQLRSNSQILGTKVASDLLMLSNSSLWCTFVADCELADSLHYSNYICCHKIVAVQTIILIMATYIQTTIHSKTAKQQKTSSQGLGNLHRGIITANHRSQPKELQREFDISREIEILPKSKVNVNRKMRNKVIPTQNKGEEIVLMQSGVFPAIYFKKTTMRNILKQFVFPADVRALPPTDDRTPLIYQIVSNLFNEITFYIFNVLIGQNTLTNSFYIFFSDSQTLPFTKCCNAPVYVELQPNGSGKILCNALKCPHANIAEFLINFQDGRKLWSNITYFSQASEKDKELRSKISKVIVNGRFRKTNLVGLVQQTSKEIVDLFYSAKQGQSQSQLQDIHEEAEENPFITANYHSKSQQQPAQAQEPSDSLQDLLAHEENNIDMLKMKIGLVAKRAGDMSRKIARSIVNQGKVFHKNFDMIKKIDEFMLTQKSSKHSTKFNFPRLMDQLRKTKQRESASKDSQGRPVSHSFA